VKSGFIKEAIFILQFSKYKIWIFNANKTPMVKIGAIFNIKWINGDKLVFYLTIKWAVRL